MSGCRHCSLNIGALTANALTSIPRNREWTGCTLQELGKYGTLYIEVTYHPFVTPEKQEAMQKKIEESRRKALEVSCIQGDTSHF
jgi:hypothetical protein